MNRPELIKEISNQTGLSKKDAEIFQKAFEQVITETLTNREKVALTGFGTFDTADRAERQGRNPSTGEDMVIEASVAAKFKASKKLKDAVNGK